MTFRNEFRHTILYSLYNFNKKKNRKDLACLAIQSCLTLCDPLDCTCQAPLSMGFPKQEYWSGILEYWMYLNKAFIKASNTDGYYIYLFD